MKILFILLSVFASFFSNANTQTSKKRDCLNGGFVCIENKDGSKILVVNAKEYPAVSYYDSVSIVRIDANNFQVINDYDYSSPVTIYSYFTIKNKIVYLKSIQTLSFPNALPRGARKECKVVINSIYNKPLEYYIDGTVFLEDKNVEKNMHCKEILKINGLVIPLKIIGCFFKLMGGRWICC